jgi:hypothetical protein
MGHQKGPILMKMMLLRVAWGMKEKAKTRQRRIQTRQQKQHVTTTCDQSIHGMFGFVDAVSPAFREVFQPLQTLLRYYVTPLVSRPFFHGISLRD